jgi:hypothetical protein
MAKGNKKVRDNIPATSTRRADEVDTLSSVDRGHDFVAVNKTAQIGRNDN